ncbi:MAG: hypothetical protein ACXWR1_05215 [Bdellovibrionota bacterium]
MKTVSLVLSTLLFSLCAHAADSSVNAPAPVAESSTAPSGNAGLLKKFEENHTITDAELKSREGSLSRFSLKANFSYYGPTLDDLTVTNQPNPDGTVSASAVGPSGSVGARYRFDPTTSLTLNAGLTDQYLFTTKPATVDVNNPFFTVDKSFKLGGWQFVASPGATLITSNVFRPQGEVAGLDARLYSSHNLGSSPISVGASTTASYYFFNREYIADDANAIAMKRGRPQFSTIRHDGRNRRISITIAPVVKYNVTSKFNVNTSWGFNIFNPRYYDNQLKMNSRVVNEWVGVGYAITRDIYINPYVQFYPTQFSWKTATMNLSTVISLL